MSDSKPYYKFAAVLAAAGLAAGAGYIVYKYVLSDTDDDSAVPSSVLAPSTSAPVRQTPAVKRKASPVEIKEIPSVSKASQPAPPKPKGGLGALPPKPGSGSSAAGGAGANLKQCAHCKKALAGLPQRCSQCKSTYYCSQACQKQAWPEHKTSCSKGKSISNGGGADSEQQAEASTSKPVEDAPTSDQAAATSTSVPATSGDAAAPTAPVEQKAPSNIQEALARLLKEQADSRSGSLEGAFELGVMLFVQGETRSALAKFSDVQQRAKEEDNQEMFGELYKWIGHCHHRLAEADKACTAFNSGVEVARAKSAAKLEIECLCGLGAVKRAQANHVEAVKFFQVAARKADEVGDNEAKATVLSNMGAALMGCGENEDGLACLQLAVKLREDMIEAAHARDDRGALAAAVMEHASSLVNLASALSVMRKYEQAKAAYEQALEVFELIEDADKVSKVLINLHNMAELQLNDAQAALKYRGQLVAFLKSHDLRLPDDTCPVCLDSLNMAKPTAGQEDKEVIIMGCLHCAHNACFRKWTEKEASGSGSGSGGGAGGQEEPTPCCPTCRTPVPLFGE